MEFKARSNEARPISAGVARVGELKGSTLQIFFVPSFALSTSSFTIRPWSGSTNPKSRSRPASNVATTPFEVSIPETQSRSSSDDSQYEPLLDEESLESSGSDDSFSSCDVEFQGRVSKTSTGKRAVPQHRRSSGVCEERAKKRSKTVANSSVTKESDKDSKEQNPEAPEEDGSSKVGVGQVRKATEEPEKSTGKGSGKKRSKVWDHFIKADGKAEAECTHCGESILCTGGNTSGMSNHLKRRHEINLTQSRLSLKNGRLISHPLPNTPTLTSKQHQCVYSHMLAMN